MDYLSISEVPFVKALQNDEVVYVGKNGLWNTYPWWFPRLIKRQLRHLITLLDDSEKLPLLIDKTDKRNPKTLSIQARYLDAIIAMESYVLRRGFSKKHPLFHRFKLRLLALMYRLEEIRKTDYDHILYAELLLAAVEWKKHEKSYWKPAIDSKEEHIIQKCCEYPHFIKEVFNSSKTLKFFFKWVLRDRLPIEPLIQYPAMMELLHRCLLVGRISKMGGHLLEIKETPLAKDSEVIEKTLTLPFEGKSVNILDTHAKVKLRGEYTLTIAQVLEIFEKKKFFPGNLEFLHDGIINWNTHKLAYWDAPEKLYVTIDLLCEEWWKQLPELETVTTAQAREKYGVFLDGIHWNFAIRASREDHSLNFERCHSYLEIAIPCGKDHYAIYDFGKFATKFPENEWQKLWQFSVFSPAAIAYPDENIFFTHRQHVNFSHLTTQEEGLAIMSSIKDDMIEARKNNLVFQIESENCGNWIYGILFDHLGATRVPNHYKIALIHTEPQGLIKWIFDCVKKLPSKFHNRALTWLHLPFGAWKGVHLMKETGESTHKSLTKTDFWQDTVVFLPAMLHRKYEEDHISQAIEVRIPSPRK